MDSKRYFDKMIHFGGVCKMAFRGLSVELIISKIIGIQYHLVQGYKLLYDLDVAPYVSGRLHKYSNKEMK